MTAARDALRERLQALIALQRPAQAAELAEQALARAPQAALDDPAAAADTLLGIVRDLLQSLPAEAPLLPPDDEDRAPFDTAARTALRACFTRLGTDASKLILGYYEFGSDAGGQTVAARQRRRAQLAARLGMTPEALRARALAIRAELEACVDARCAVPGNAP